MLHLGFAQAAQESPEVINSKELVEPTLVLQFPSQAATGMYHNRAAAYATDTAAQAQDSSVTRVIAQQPTFSTGSECAAAKDCSQMAGSLSNHSTAAQPEQLKVVYMMPAPCLQPMAAVSICEADGAMRQQSDATKTNGNAFSRSEQPSHQTVVDADRQNASPEEQATVPEGQATAPNGQIGSSEGRATVVGGQHGSPEGQATVPDRQYGSPERQAPIPDGQHASPEGQTLIADGQAAKTDGQDDDTPVVSDDTIGEACCVCKSAEDGEVLLLCDNCNQPAHLGCVGVETVPEGDWFCPSCTSVMVSISTLCATRPRPHPALLQHHIEMTHVLLC